jgi:putative kinase
MSIARDPCKRLCRSSLTLDGTDFTLTVSPHDCANVYLPLALALIDQSENRNVGPLMVGIAGPPGSGKSATSAILSALINDCISDRPDDRALVIPLDGFHYPNAWLDSHTGEDHWGNDVALRTVKGWHTTFDSYRALSLLNRARSGEVVRFPVYSRDIHEPVDDALEVRHTHDIIIVEGNYLYMDTTPWDRIREVFDVRVFVTVEFAVLERQITERHMRGRSSAEEAEDRIRRVDRPNMEAVLPTVKHAHYVIAGERGGLTLSDLHG